MFSASLRLALFAALTLMSPPLWAHTTTESSASTKDKDKDKEIRKEKKAREREKRAREQQAREAAEKSAGPFSAGSKRISITGGTGYAYGERYIILGGALGAFFADGLELGVEGEYWIGEDPSIFKLSPQVRYVFHQVPTLNPYVGVFYRRQFIGEKDGYDYPDVGSAGARAGVFYVTGSGGYFGGGIVHERILECDDDVNDECAITYPELALSFSF